MDDLVSEEGDKEGGSSNNNDTSPARHVTIDSIEELSANNNIHRRPTNASKNVEDSDDFDAIPSKVKSRQDHLSKSKPWAKGWEEADWNYAEKIDEEDDQDRIDESKIKDGVGEGSNSKCRDDHVRRTPQRPDLRHPSWQSFIRRYTLNTSLLDTEFSSKSLCSCIETICPISSPH